MVHALVLRRRRPSRTRPPSWALCAAALGACGLLWCATAAAKGPRHAGAAQKAAAPKATAPKATAPNAGAPDAGPAGDDAPATVAPGVQALLDRAAQVDALAAGKLPPAVSPRSLFDVDLDDEAAVSLEVVRLKALAAIAPPKANAKRADAGIDARTALWGARRAFDEARLAFLSLPAAKRKALLEDHQRRVAALSQAATAAATAAATREEVEQRAKEAEEEREQALQAAKDARSEAERLVSEELARLLSVEQAQADFAGALAQRTDIDARREATLGWQRKAREAHADKAAPDDVDALYDDIVRALRLAHDQLSSALDDLSAGKSAVPSPGPDPLGRLGADVDVTAVREARHRVEEEARRLTAQESRVREGNAAQLFDEVDVLNQLRLGLLPLLTSHKRDAVTGISADGLPQAAMELRHLLLVLRYHRHATTRWLSVMRKPATEGAPAGGTEGLGVAARLAFLAFRWGVAIALFVWWRRRAPAFLEGALKRARQNDRAQHLAQPSPLFRAVLFLKSIRRSLEWLVLFAVLGWLLPDGAADLLEVQLITVALAWILAGALAVNTVNAIADTGRRHSADKELRLRSLRLVGRVIIVFGLTLSISARVVGRGTIYGWVFSTCWFAAVPVFLILVRWWRAAVFTRMEAHRRSSTFERWVLDNKVGWKSFIAAMGGAVFLFGRGAYRVLRIRAGGFDVTRRALAWLFRRELQRLEPEHASALSPLSPLTPPSDLAMSPQTTSAVRITTELDPRLDEIAARMRARKGRVVAVVAERGMGKSATLARLAADVQGCLRLDAASPDLDALLPTARAALDLPDTASLADVATRLDDEDGPPAVLIDDAQRFVLPLMGGLRSFDTLIGVARANSSRCAWLLAFDNAIWQFLERSRGLHPLFDDVIRVPRWREPDVAELLRSRCLQAGIEPSYERLLEGLPKSADAVDREEALADRATGYSRLVWDYAGGNPAVALDVWRRALGVDADGRVLVRLFPSLDSADLERLPDAAVFVLRAILQMAPVAAPDIRRATLLHGSAVADALRYALARGYVTEDDGRFTITWTWLRPITRLLQRKHLLVVS